jgi:small GTP-binding protein
MENSSSFEPSQSESRHAEPIDLLLCGGPHVGKTALAAQLIQETFLTEPSATIGVKKTYWTGPTGTRTKIHDVGGQLIAMAGLGDVFQSADAVLIVCDIDRERSFDEAVEWLDKVTQHAAASRPTFLVVNKIDVLADGDAAALDNSPNAPWKEPYRAIAEKWGFQGPLFTSAKTHALTRPCFELVADAGLQYHSSIRVDRVEAKPKVQRRVDTGCACSVA